MTIHDLIITEDFMRDHDTAPPYVQKRMDTLTQQILEGKRYPNSMNVHAAKSTDLFIGYVTVTKGGHWRVLFWEDRGKVYLHRLMKHDEVDIYLRSLGKGK